MPYASERSDFTVLTGYCWLGKKRRYGRRPGWSRAGAFHFSEEPLTRIFHESLAATTDMPVLPGVLGCRPLRRTVQVRLGTNTLRLPSGTPIFVVSRQQFMKYPG